MMNWIGSAATTGKVFFGMFGLAAGASCLPMILGFLTEQVVHHLCLHLIPFAHHIFDMCILGNCWWSWIITRCCRYFTYDCKCNRISLFCPCICLLYWRQSKYSWWFFVSCLNIIFSRLVSLPQYLIYSPLPPFLITPHPSDYYHAFQYNREVFGFGFIV